MSNFIGVLFVSTSLCRLPILSFRKLSFKYKKLLTGYPCKEFHQYVG
ncbi:hypothetical protein HMPREF9012_1277 [Bacteroidetes bacterium oral taxon 272 str. F0290]|nr:hypothetical protein HMPREF9012_1277 [Bacteroidetes bacterium oral taxon 272 str. F0290]